jgi:hypothetical protein
LLGQPFLSGVGREAGRSSSSTSRLTPCSRSAPISSTTSGRAKNAAMLSATFGPMSRIATSSAPVAAITSSIRS